MARLGGADELIVRGVQELRHLLETRGILVDELLGRDAFLSGGLRDLDAVLVSAGQEEHVVAVEPLEARDRVGGDDLVAIADVWRTVRIRDRGRDVIAGLFSHLARSMSKLRHARACRGHPRLASCSAKRRGWPGQARP